MNADLAALVWCALALAEAALLWWAWRWARLALAAAESRAEELATELADARRLVALAEAEISRLVSLLGGNTRRCDLRLRPRIRPGPGGT